MNRFSSHSVHVFTVSTLAALGLSATAAQASVTAADRGWFITDATVASKAPNTTLHIWQQLHSGDWVDTGLTVDTDGSGNGHGWEVHSSGIGSFHDHRPTVTGSATAPDPAQTPSPYLASVLPRAFPSDTLVAGLNPGGLRLANSRTDVDGHVFMETWEPGTIISIQVDPAQGQFALGAVSITCPGVNISPMNMSPTNITFRIASNVNPQAPSTIAINGVGLMVLGAPGTTLDLILDAQGSTIASRDGQPLERATFSFGQVRGPIQTLQIVRPCRADFNGDGAVNSQDFFDFLRAFFAGAAAADYNRDGRVNSQDFFDFMSDFFAGC